MKNKKLLIIMSMFLLVLTPFVVAQPPFQTQENEQGLQIFYPEFPEVPQYMEFNLHIHVSNISTGLQVPNNLADCYIHLYDTDGSHLLESDVFEKDSNGLDHEIELNSSLFNEMGLYSFLIWCNATDIGGEVKGTYEVTTAEDKQFILNLNDNVQLIVLIILFLLSTVLLFTKYHNLSGFGFIVAGLILIFSGTNFIVSSLILALGLFIGILSTKK